MRRRRQREIEAVTDAATNDLVAQLQKGLDLSAGVLNPEFVKMIMTIVNAIARSAYAKGRSDGLKQALETIDQKETDQ